MRKIAAEVLGTFALVFAGTGAIVINDVAGGAVYHVGIALTFGLFVLAMIYALGDVSGAHLNPAVTLAVCRRATAGVALGAALGHQSNTRRDRRQPSSARHVPAASHVGCHSPAGTGTQSFIFEIVLTLVLMLVILSVSAGAKQKGIKSGIAIRSIITQWRCSPDRFRCLNEPRPVAGASAGVASPRVCGSILPHQ